MLTIGQALRLRSVTAIAVALIAIAAPLFVAPSAQAAKSLAEVQARVRQLE